MAEPADQELQTITRLPSRFSADSHKSLEKPHKTPLTCKDIDDDEKFIRLVLQLALAGERISGASEEGGIVTIAEEKSDPFHVPLPDEVPVQKGPEPRSEPADSGGGKAHAEQTPSTPVDDGVDAPASVVDDQVSAPGGGVPAPRGSGAESAIPPMPSTPPATPDSDPHWWRVSTDEPKNEAPSKASPNDTRPGWWSRLYEDQDADLDTYTGHTLTVPADGGPVLIQVQKSPEPEAPDQDDDEATDESPARLRIADVQKPQPSLQIRRQPAKRWRLTRFWRVVIFNGSAAAVGTAIGLNSYLSQFLPAAVTAAGGLLGAGMALGGAFAAWKAAGSELLAPFVPFGALGRLGAVFVSAEVGRRLGQAILPYTAATIDRYVGLNQTDTSLLIVALTMCGVSGWLVWRTRHGSLPKRWLARIPLATSFLVCALYSNGPVF
ncbi:hypothetical protein [Streptomyces sp. NPDC002553]|uniref:hypothetical protein n=1 Tax=Streptomyces sp. NPDC002553 TaxID=3154417 RepID=UPI00332F10FA